MNISAVILTGGKNSRMKGEDKSLLKIEDEKIIDIQLDILKNIFDEVMIIGKDYSSISFKVPAYKDIIANYGSLSGIHTALSYAKNEHVFIVSCDMPFISKSFIQLMIESVGIASYDAIVPLHNKGIEPLHALYKKKLLNTTEKLISSGQKRISTLLEYAHSYFICIPSSYDPQHIFFNINNPQDYINARIYAKSIK